MSSTEAVPSTQNGRSAHILLVEDECDVRAAIRTQLQDEGHEVVEAESGSEALALAEQSPFDILLTDVMIPDLNGIELVQKVARLQSCPITIVMTGYGSIEMAVQAIKAGAFDFLQSRFRLKC